MGSLTYKDYEDKFHIRELKCNNSVAVAEKLKEIFNSDLEAEQKLFIANFILNRNLFYYIQQLKIDVKGKEHLVASNSRLNLRITRLLLILDENNIAVPDGEVVPLLKKKKVSKKPVRKFNRTAKMSNFQAKPVETKDDTPVPEGKKRIVVRIKKPCQTHED